MMEISSFFNRIQSFFSKEVILRTKIKEAIKNYSNVEVKLEDIEFKNGHILIKNQNSTAYSEIFIKRQKILDELNSHSKTIIFKDIR